MIRIAGAGLAGLLAAHAWPTAIVFESEAKPRASHRALLRFRTESVSQLTGIEFKPVTVRKGIWYNGEFVPPSIDLANRYSTKILGAVESDRSIWNTEPVTRYIAPESLYEQLVEAVGAQRIQWGVPCEFTVAGSSIINTAPLPILLGALGIGAGLTFQRSEIRVERFRVPRCDVYQTVYFPGMITSVYRASITGDLLIMELAGSGAYGAHDLAEVMKAFAIEQVEYIDGAEQRFGKIIPMDNGERRALLGTLTRDYGIFSLGRFATWRNILLDDVVKDIAVIRRLLRATQYERSLFKL